jgi:hypothetical protein
MIRWTFNLEVDRILTLESFDEYAPARNLLVVVWFSRAFHET